MLSRPQTPVGWYPYMRYLPQSQIQGSTHQAITYTHNPSGVGQPQGLIPVSEVPTLAAFLNQIVVPPNLGDIDFDVSQISDGGESIVSRYRGTEDQIACTQEFRNWILASSSGKLLVHGDYPSGGSHHASPISLFCITLLQALFTKSSYIPLIFFCGQHIEPEDGAGGQVMIMSLISQILKQHAYIPVLFRHQLDQQSIRRGDVHYLCSLFEFLVRSLPSEQTVVCIIDGISYYETDEFEDEMIMILKCLLGLVRDSGLRPAVKLLVCSPATTDRVQFEFGGVDANILNLAGTRLLSQEAGSLFLNDDLEQV